ncbi:HTH_Tnp_Tc3_2 domain-containing protein [Trichonephila clavipes]|nr:HTH_Tnp_Tc3_2 domain-containing protein [Trichonephila clavipes]
MRKCGGCDNCIYSAYCDCPELVVGVGIATMGKLPDLDAFDRGRTVGARRMGHSASEIVRQLGFSSQRSRTLAQNTSKLKVGASRTVSKWTVQRSLHRMVLGSHRPTRVPLLRARHRAARLA